MDMTSMDYPIIIHTHVLKEHQYVLKIYPFSNDKHCHRAKDESVLVA